MLLRLGWPTADLPPSPRRRLEEVVDWGDGAGGRVVEVLPPGTALPYSPEVFEFIETPFFTKAVGHYLADDEYSLLQAHLNLHPDAGAVIPGSGGLRKLR